MLRQLSELLQSVETQKTTVACKQARPESLSIMRFPQIGHVPASTSIVCPGTTFSLNNHSYKTIPAQTLNLIDKNVVQAPNLSPMHKGVISLVNNVIPRPAMTNDVDPETCWVNCGK